MKPSEADRRVPPNERLNGQVVIARDRYQKHGYFHERHFKASSPAGRDSQLSQAISSGMFLTSLRRLRPHGNPCAALSSRATCGLLAPTTTLTSSRGQRFAATLPSHESHVVRITATERDHHLARHSGISARFMLRATNSCAAERTPVRGDIECLAGGPGTDPRHRERNSAARHNRMEHIFHDHPAGAHWPIVSERFDGKQLRNQTRLEPARLPHIALSVWQSPRIFVAANRN